MKKAVRGFTLVELVIVLVVVAILAAFAIARFADLRSSARTAVIEQVAGSMRSLSGLVHAQALVDNVDDSNDYDYAGLSIDLRGGYTVATGITPGAMPWMLARRSLLPV